MPSSDKTPSNEFERLPVPEGSLKFWDMNAGEHAHGAEFMIGPLFLAADASLQNLLLGLSLETSSSSLRVLS
tara:strand:- start:158 stop:373 length:216 start_codon:yes stop_codon:yes gene_type:complete